MPLHQNKWYNISSFLNISAGFKHILYKFTHFHNDDLSFQLIYCSLHKTCRIWNREQNLESTRLIHSVDNIHVLTSHPVLVTSPISIGLRDIATAEAAVNTRLPPKYMYVSRILCRTTSGQTLKDKQMAKCDIFHCMVNDKYYQFISRHIHMFLALCEQDSQLHRSSYIRSKNNTIGHIYKINIYFYAKFNQIILHSFEEKRCPKFASCSSL